MVFNLALSYLLYENTQEDLESALNMVQVLIREEFSSKSQEIDRNNQDVLRSTIESLNKTIRLANKTQNTEIFFIANNGRSVFPKDLSDSLVDKNLLDQLIENREDLEFNTTFERTYNKKTYLINVSKIKTAYSKLNQNILLIISPLDTSNKLLSQLNIILLAIILLAIILATIIARIISKGIARPIIQASNHAKVIAEGKYLQLDIPKSSREIETLYQSLNHMSRALEKSSEEQQNYFQNLSHDLRTPLMSIQGYAEGIQAGIFDDSQQAASIIQSESIRLKNLVDQLLTLSKLDNNHKKVISEKFIIKEALDEIVTRYKGLSQSQKKTITINAPDHLIMNTDLSVFDKIISNILSNAIKYADHIVVINVLEMTENIQITIQDDGPGIDENLDLFKRFSKGKSGNFGLGLAIVASAMTIIHGEVSWENSHKGAIFTLTFEK
jgi:signal transduction histidine kinase